MTRLEREVFEYFLNGAAFVSSVEVTNRLFGSENPLSVLTRRRRVVFAQVLNNLVKSGLLEVDFDPDYRAVMGDGGRYMYTLRE